MHVVFPLISIFRFKFCGIPASYHLCVLIWNGLCILIWIRSWDWWYGMVELEERVGSNFVQVCGLKSLKRVLEVKNHMDQGLQKPESEISRWILDKFSQQLVSNSDRVLTEFRQQERVNFGWPNSEDGWQNVDRKPKLMEFGVPWRAITWYLSLSHAQRKFIITWDIFRG